MFKPRRGTLNLFTAGENHQILLIIFYAVLRSLDKMGEVKNSNFRDHSSVNAKLVKLLSLNSSVEAVNKLQKDYVDISKTNTATSKPINRPRTTLHNNVHIIAMSFFQHI